MATQKARIGGGALTVLGLASLVGWLRHAACLLITFVGMPVKAFWEALPSVILTVWHILEPCLFAHSGLLEGLLQVSLYWAHFALAFAAAA